MKHLLFNLLISIISLNLCLNSFQTSFFKQMNKNFIKKNLILSPLSVYQILSLTSNGAKGKTLQEMLLSLSSTELDELNKINLAILNTVKEFKSIEMANAVMTAFTPEEKFTNMAYTYESTVEALRNVEQVNKWCKEKTHEKINKILDEIEPNTVMILLNAIYFKGIWTKQFDPKNTYKMNFYNFGDINNAVTIDTMHIKEKFNYFEDEFTQVIEIPFNKDSASAIVFLPRKDNDINYFIADLEEKKIKEYIDSMEPYTVDLSLPKFELEFSSQLNEALQKLGMKEVFNPAKADLTGMRKEGNIYISKVIHKTYLKVDEAGAEAAGVTAVVIKTRGFNPKNKRMVINRPFFMILKSKDLPQNYDALFMAKIEKLK